METPTKKGFKWNAEAERDLYAACLVALGEPKGQTLRQAVEILEDSLGVVVTVKAASHRVQHLQKLKRKEGAPATDGGSAKKVAVARGKKRSKDEGDHDDEAEAAPAKKVARGKKAADPIAADDDKDGMKLVKNEHEDSDDDAI